jgi:hypothetical protein
MTPRHAVLLICLLVSLGPTQSAEFRNSDLIGHWSGKAKDGTKITYHFQKDGLVVWFVDEPHFKSEAPSGLRAKYTIRESSAAWELDIHDFEDIRFKKFIFQAIFQPVEKGRLKLEGLPSSRGRPRIFSDEAIVFSKDDS